MKVCPSLGSLIFCQSTYYNFCFLFRRLSDDKSHFCGQKKKSVCSLVTNFQYFGVWKAHLENLCVYSFFWENFTFWGLRWHIWVRGNFLITFAFSWCCLRCAFWGEHFSRGNLKFFFLFIRLRRYFVGAKLPAARMGFVFFQL